MSSTEKNISSKDMWRLVDETFNLMHQELHHHHQMVGYLAFRMAAAAGLSPAMRHLTLQAAYLHDIGAVLARETLTLEDIEQAGFRAAQISANLLEDFPNFLMLAAIVRHCQSPYRALKGLQLPELMLPPALSALSERVPRLQSPLAAANLIHLADAVSLQIQKDCPVLNQVQEILAAARQSAGDEFSPQAVAALEQLAAQDQVWLDLAYAPERILELAVEESYVGEDEALQISKLIAMIIDFRSPFTAMHSAGVAASARMLAKLAGMNERECAMTEIAGYLHDLGKVRTPQEILEKPGALDREEFNVIKEHAFFTDLLLSRVQGFESIAKWAALHHEKMNGTGYPYRLTADEIPLGAKVMAVADVFSAITEERPYRKGMAPDRVKSILRENAAKGELSVPLAELLIEHFDEVNQARDKASREAGRRYYRSLQQDEKASI